MHTRKRYDAAGIKDGTMLVLLNDIRGGGKRGRVSAAEMKVKPGDVPAIAAIFSETSFAASSWLATLTKKQANLITNNI